jgi:DNA-directed RNA polymerase subunit RPC12/RpoP
MSHHTPPPPFHPTDYRETCPRCSHSGIQALARDGLYECTNCAAVYFACPECGTRMWDEAPDGRPARCQDCGHSFG